MDLAVEVAGLSKAYAGTPALSGVDFAVTTGTVLGLLGPNGAGKTTLVRVLATLLAPDAGRASVAGHDVVRDPHAVRASIALAGQYAGVDDLLTARENLNLIGRLRHLGRRGARARTEALLGRFGLTEEGDRPVRTYSGGMRRRLDLACCLVVTPTVLFLDEPTTGLDPASRLTLWAVVRGLVADGVTVLLTTQYLEEADQLAGRVVVIAAGTVIAEGTPAQLKERAGAVRAEVTVARADLATAESALADVAAATPTVDTTTCTVGVPLRDGTGDLAALVLALSTRGVPVADLVVRRPTLDDAYLGLVAGVAAG